MVAAQQHPWHLFAPKVGRAGVLGIFQQPRGEALVFAGFVGAQHPRHQPGHRVDHHQRPQLAAGEHVVADGQLLVDHRVQRPLVHALVVAAEQGQFRLSRQFLDDALVQRAPPGGEVDAPSVKVLRQVGREGVHDGLGGHHHARAAAEGIVVGVAVLFL